MPDEWLLGPPCVFNEVDTVSHRGHLGRLQREVRVGIGRGETEVKTLKKKQKSRGGEEAAPEGKTK